jgi:hypothetical protein
MAYPGDMKRVAVFVRLGGPVRVACRAYPSPTGAVWHCAHCNAAIISASFGVLSGFWRCPCGADVGLFVDGKQIDMQEMNALAPIPPRVHFVGLFVDGEQIDMQEMNALAPIPPRVHFYPGQEPEQDDLDREMALSRDEEFLRELNITPSLAITED